MSDKFYDFKNMDWAKGIGNWESPVHISEIMGEISQKITEDGEMQIMQEIRRVVDVNKEELIKALNYDRNQYNKGYEDAEAKYKRPQGEWIDYSVTFYKCPECGYLLEKYCPRCQNKVILPKGGEEE